MQPQLFLLLMFLFILYRQAIKLYLLCLKELIQSCLIIYLIHFCTSQGPSPLGNEVQTLSVC